MNSNEKILKIVDLVAGYNGSSVLRGLNLALNTGEVCCVIGEEGSGKSTLLKAITQQLKTSGEITYHDLDLKAIPTSEIIRHKIDFIAQGGNILPNFTIQEHIRLALSEKSEVERIKTWQLVEEAFPKMKTLRKQIAGRLSGGERMILSLACLMATDADLWILDEPTAGLAPETCELIKAFLTRMKDERGKTILMMEHNYDFVFEIADSVVTLSQGAMSEKYRSDDFRQPGFVDAKLYGSIK